jgi:signal transduction histidine kinase
VQHANLLTRGSIFLKLATFVAFVVILTATLVSWVGFRFARNSLTTEIHTRLDTLAHNREERLRAYVSQQKERAALVASRTRLRTELMNRLDKAAPESADFLENTRRILIDANETLNDFLAIWVTDPEGTVVTATDDAYLGRDFSSDADYQRGRHERHLGTPRFQNGNLVAQLVAPAYSEDGVFLGVVMVLLDLHPLEDLRSDRTGLGETGDLIVARVDGDRLRRLIPLHNESQAGITFADAPALAAAVEGSHGRGLSILRGNQVLASWQPFAYQSPDFQKWGMIVKIDASEAYAPIASLRQLQWILEGVLVVLGIVIAQLVARRFCAPIQAMAGVAKQLAQGNLAARVEVQSADEVGELAESLNQMADELSLSHAQLESRIAERTSELEQNNQQLELAKAALEQSNQDLQQFASVASHDLQEPLRAVSGYCQLLQSKLGDHPDNDVKTFLEHAIDGAKRMKALIDSLLDFARVGTRGDSMELIDTRVAVEEALANLGPAIEDSGAQVNVGELPQLFADCGQLVRLFQNLIGNAIKFRSERRPRVDITAEEHDEHWLFCVRDNGIGIESRYADRIFVIFQRLHTRDEYPGTGLGLAITKRIVERHGGKIWMESRVDAGSAFLFTIFKRNI